MIGVLTRPPHKFRRLVVVFQLDKLRVSQVTIRRPFGQLYLGNYPRIFGLPTEDENRWLI